MFRLSAILVVATFAGRHLLSSHAALLPNDPESARPTADAKASDPQRPIQDVSALVAAVHGLPGVVCGLTAEAAAGWGGRSWMNAPAPPLGPDASERVADFPRARLSLRDVAMLIDSVTSSDACVRELAVRLIGRAPAELVEDRLIARVGSSQPAPTREAAVLALGLVESKAGVTPLLRLVMDEGMGVRANAIWALGRIGDRRASAPLRRSLSDQAAVVREAALGALGALEDTGSVDEIVRVLRSDRAARVRRTAAWALGTLEAREADDALVTVLRGEKDVEVREMIVWALGTLEAVSAQAALVDMLRHDTNAAVRENAAWALGQSEATTAAPALGEAAGSDANADVRGTAAWALGQMELRQAPEGLIRAVTDRDAEVRTRSAWSLSQIGDARAVSQLRAALRTETDATARKAQLRALIRAGERSAAFFKELLTSDDEEVRASAVAGMAGRGTDPWPWPMPRPRPFP